MDQEKKYDFGFLSRRPGKKQEELKHDFPYVEIVPPGEGRSVTKFRLLNGAGILLELKEKDNTVAYFQNSTDADRFFLANTSDIEDNPQNCKVNLDNSFNSAPLHKRMVGELKLDIEHTLCFKVEDVTGQVPGYEGLKIAELLPIVVESHLTVVKNDTVESDVLDEEVPVV